MEGEIENFLRVPSNDPHLPSLQSASEDSLLAFKDSFNSRINAEGGEDDWEEAAEDDTLSIIPDPFEWLEVESWKDFYLSLREETSIQEIIIPEKINVIGHLLVEDNEERKKYQRFREKKFVCDECDRTFTLKQNVQQHIVIYHMNGVRQLKEKIAKKFKCLKCDQVFTTLEQAQKHDTNKHGIKMPTMRVFKCEECPKVYPTNSALKEHVSVQHLKEKPFECAECGLRFGRKGGLRRHVQMVHEHQIYLCPFEGCNHPGYKCTKALSAHIRSVHTKDRPFMCMLCERTFVRKNDLKTHEMTHQATAAFVCPTCPKAFKRIAGLRNHKKRCNGGVKKEEGVECRVKGEVEDGVKKEEKHEEEGGRCNRPIKVEEPSSP